MKRDKEWLKNQIEIMGSETSENYPHEQMVDREVVLKLVDQLDEPEKVVVPHVAAEWFEFHKHNLNDALNILAYDMGHYNDSQVLSDFAEWYFNIEDTLITLSEMRHGYEIEKEPQIKSIAVPVEESP